MSRSDNLNSSLATMSYKVNDRPVPTILVVDIASVNLIPLTEGNSRHRLNVRLEKTKSRTLQIALW